jgi:nicotinamide mononucleotide transporter
MNSLINKVSSAFKKYFVAGYTPLERIFMATIVAMQIIVYCIAPNGWFSLVAGIAGCISVVMCAKGRLEFYFIGFLQNFSYMWLAYQNRFYGEIIENIFYIVTMIWGIFVWGANMQPGTEDTEDVIAKKFNLRQWVTSITLTIAATALMGKWLTSIGSNQAYLDAATNVMAIFAQIMMVKRYREQWLWWFIIDIINIVMWSAVGNWSMVAMYVAWTANCIYGWVNWTKLNRVA